MVSTNPRRMRVHPQASLAAKILLCSAVSVP